MGCNPTYMTILGILSCLLGARLEDAGHGRHKPMALHFNTAPAGGIMPCGFQGDVVAFDQLHQVLVEAVHAFVERSFNVTGKQIEVVSGNGISGAGVVLHDFQAGNALVESAGTETLADDGI